MQRSFSLNQVTFDWRLKQKNNKKIVLSFKSRFLRNKTFLTPSNPMEWAHYKHEHTIWPKGTLNEWINKRIMFFSIYSIKFEIFFFSFGFVYAESKRLHFPASMHWVAWCKLQVLFLDLSVTDKKSNKVTINSKIARLHFEVRSTLCKWQDNSEKVI